MSKKFFKELPVCGLYSVKALAEYHPEKVSRLFFSEDTAKHFGKLCKYLAGQKRLYRIVSESELEKLSASKHHQGVTAMIYEPVIPRLEISLIDYWAKNSASVLMLDEVGNANNLGAIIRSAAFFGIEHTGLPKAEWNSLIYTGFPRRIGFCANAAASLQVSARTCRRITVLPK